ncbi:hypothetical protein [Glycomyces tenuis]|uniref:hypothetical protein n=1 Tax=Glycomyces tenuis TaxID=58116 RepID=UPI00047DDEAF|nr:hypothetical protein [Glycomyces tenuis]
MRTTVDLPNDLHQQALAIARDTATTLSDVVAKYFRRGLQSDHLAEGEVRRSPLTGLPVVSVGHVVTSEDVRSLEDDE